MVYIPLRFVQGLATNAYKVEASIVERVDGESDRLFVAAFIRPLGKYSDIGGISRIEFVHFLRLQHLISQCGLVRKSQQHNKLLDALGSHEARLGGGKEESRGYLSPQDACGQACCGRTQIRDFGLEYV